MYRDSAEWPSALVGAALAVLIVVTTLTFGSGLQTLASHPALYGWNFTYMLNPTSSVPPQALALLAHDHDVAAWTGVVDTNIDINVYANTRAPTDGHTDTDADCNAGRHPAPPSQRHAHGDAAGQLRGIYLNQDATPLGVQAVRRG